MSPTWSVVATVDEPPALIRAFVAWYLHLGADEVFLYFDRPDDPAAAMMNAIPGVRVMCCDRQHWARLGRSRPHRHQIRQTRNATDAYRRTSAAWLLHVDADEFLWVDDPVHEALRRIEAGMDGAVVPVAERVLVENSDDTIFAGAFRRPFPGTAAEGHDLFGADFDLTLRGLTGHVIGKSFARVGQELQMSIHRPKRTGSKAVATTTLDAMALLHFDGLTRLQWTYKLLRKADAFSHEKGMPPSQHRGRQIAAILLAPEKGFAIYDQIKRATPALRAQLEALDLWCAASFDPVAALARVFPGQSVDLSSQAFDAWLWDQKGDLLRRYGLQPEV